MIQKHICLLPAHHAENEIKKIEEEYTDTQRLNDEALQRFLNGKASGHISFAEEIMQNRLVRLSLLQEAAVNQKQIQNNGVHLLIVHNVLPHNLI